MTDDIETKLSAARTRLILDRPFLGALVLRLPIKAAKPERCKTIGTDVRALYYNPEYINNLTLEQTQFVLAHEALHCALSHFARRHHRVKHRWDIACDLAINPLLIKDGLKPPPGVLLKSGFEGMMAEEIYPYIDDDSDDETHDDHFYDQENKSGSSSGRQPQDGGQGGGDGADGDDGEPQLGGDVPSPLTENEQEQLAVQWRQRLAGAAQQAMQAGKLGASMARLVEHLLQPQLPWRMLLARYMSAVARDDYSYQRPSRREGSAILPTLKSAQVDLVVLLDTSGSINDTEMQQFVAEIDAIKGQLRARLTLHACDAALCEHGPWVFEPWEEFSMPENLRHTLYTRIRMAAARRARTGSIGVFHRCRR
jgi:predicted metal-dependent peptidase